MKSCRSHEETETKNITSLVFSFSPIDLAFWCFFVFCFFMSCMISSFNTYVNHKAFGTIFLYWVDFTFHSRGKVCSIDIPGSQIVVSLGACWFLLFRRPWDRPPYPKKCIIFRVPSSNTMGSISFPLIAWNTFIFCLDKKKENISWVYRCFIRVSFKASSKTLSEIS